MQKGGTIKGLSLADTDQGQRAILNRGTVHGDLLTGSGNDRVTVEYGGVVTGNINLGSGNDRLTVRKGGGVEGDIILGKGADRLHLSGFTGTIHQYGGDSGEYKLPRDRSELDVSTMDVIDADWLPGLTLTLGLSGKKSLQILNTLPRRTDWKMTFFTL